MPTKKEIEKQKNAGFSRKQRCLPRWNFYPVIKRMLDIIFSLFGMFAAAIVSVAVCVINFALGERSSVFYRQTRIGLNGIPFTMYKFRSMLDGADGMLEQLLTDSRYRAQWDKKQKLDNDPRVTKVGRFLRKYSIDELPQFFNVLKGDMSVIGPRPLVEGELICHGGDSRYYSVKPGLTGWWACNGRSDMDYEKRLKLEYYYIDNLSFPLDVKCFFRTIRCLFSGIGSR